MLSFHMWIFHIKTAQTVHYNLLALVLPLVKSQIPSVFAGSFNFESGHLPSPSCLLDNESPSSPQLLKAWTSAAWASDLALSHL